MIDFSFSSRPQHPHLTLRPTSCDQMSHFRRHWFTFEHVPPCHLSEDTSWHFLLCRSPRSLLGWQKPIPNSKKKKTYFKYQITWGGGGTLPDIRILSEEIQASKLVIVKKKKKLGAIDQTQC